MTRIVLTFGLIAGGIMSAMLAIHLAFHDAIGFDAGVIIGYASMVAAFLLIYFGVRSYRDNVLGGRVSFWHAFGVGMLITLVASVIYVGTWEVIYFNFSRDYLDKYQAHVIAKERARGATDAELAEQVAEMESFAKKYENPAFNVAVSFLEPLPVGLVMALVTAGVLSRRRRVGVTGHALA
ncbi:MAG: DUF4199 domain-containing protein [Gemmatimonadaceae bacterium]